MRLVAGYFVIIIVTIARAIIIAAEYIPSTTTPTILLLDPRSWSSTRRRPSLRQSLNELPLS
jgi:hypothetical protein